MDAQAVAGAKTELAGVSARIQKAIEDQISALASGVADCMDCARTAKRENPSDDTRSSERKDAVQMVEATAVLLQSIAKLKGEFRHNYHVTRAGDPSDAKRAKDGKPAGVPTHLSWDGGPWNGDASQLLTQEEIDALSPREETDYFRWTEGLPPKFDGFRKPKPKTDDRKEFGALAAEIERVAGIAGVPPPENRGSNADAANP